MNDKKTYIGKIENIEQVAKSCYKISFISTLNQATAGQFVSILCNENMLRRPFSIADFNKIDDNKSIISVLFKLKGKGTNYLKNLKQGDEINFIGPNGNGFEIQNKKSLLIGAGIGIAPMLFLKKELNKNNIENFLITGFKEENEAIKGSNKNIIGGSVLDNIEDLIKENNFEVIYSCGPKIVLEKLSIIAQKLNIPCYIALEKVMACSIGVCRGCVIKIKKDEIETTASVCKDGPVFLAKDIIWD